MHGILEPAMVEIIYLLMAREGIISLQACDVMMSRFLQYPPGTTLGVVVEDLRREVEVQPGPKE